MGYKPLADALAGMNKAGKDVDQPVVTGGRMEPGNVYEPTIVGISIAQLATNGHIDIQLEDEQGRYIDSRVWPVDERGGVGRVFIHILNALFARTDALDMIGQVFADVGDDVFNLLRGLKLKVSVGASEGYRNYLLPSGNYVLVRAGSDPTSPHSRVLQEEFPNLAAADAAAKAKGLRKSYAKVFKYEPISEQQAATNWDNFGKSYAALTGALKRAGSSPAPASASQAPTGNSGSADRK